MLGKSLLLMIFSCTLLISCASSHHPLHGRYVKGKKGWVFVPHSKKFRRNFELFKNNKFSISEGELLWPVPSSQRITSHYGKRGRNHHDGIDIGAKKGKSILAVADGKVLFSGYMRGYGKVVVIKHPKLKNLHSVYAHNSRNIVKKGQRVNRGQVIGKIGSTGRSTGNHLHFELRRKETPVDPLAFYGKSANRSIASIRKKK
ncbi:M23 family metallopeptidase [Bacteriovoracaceae bacterium]|nr:M23 family metallopeptidase [Bacteriovoracaceae bacterium]